MNTFGRKFNLTKRDIAAALATATISAALIPLALLLGDGWMVLAMAAMAICGFGASALLASRINRAWGEAQDLADTLRNIGNGKLDTGVFAPVILPAGPALETALNDMAVQLRSKVQRLHDDAHRDLLTGLSNRAQFEVTVQEALREANADNPHCLLFVDLDGFKQVNDTLGHKFGDRLLQIAADRLRLATNLDDFKQSDGGPPPSVHVARFGGDEFVVLLANCGSGNVARRIGGRVLRVLAEPIELGSHTASIGASIGIAFAPKNADNYSDLLRAADTAMYQAKRLGRNRCEFYNPSLDRETRAAALQEQDLREAISRGQLELYYQPLFDVRTMRISSVEALVRWNHPKRGLLLPDEFLPIIERCNLTIELGEWVINTALKTIVELEREGRAVMVAVNTSPIQIEHLEFAAFVRSSLRRWRASPGLLQIEVTEDAAMRHAERTCERLRQLHDLGVSIAIDDFGTGYSNLASLIMLPLSRLKIDRSLLRNLTEQAEARVLIQTIISMANSLGFHSVAEGIETQDQFDLLSDMGCDIVQGYLLSRPVPLDQLKSLLAQERAQDIVSPSSSSSPSLSIAS